MKENNIIELREYLPSYTAPQTPKGTHSIQRSRWISRISELIDSLLSGTIMVCCIFCMYLTITML